MPAWTGVEHPRITTLLANTRAMGAALVPAQDGSLAGTHYCRRKWPLLPLNLLTCHVAEEHPQSSRILRQERLQPVSEGVE